MTSISVAPQVLTFPGRYGSASSSPPASVVKAARELLSNAQAIHDAPWADKKALPEGLAAAAEGRSEVVRHKKADPHQSKWFAAFPHIRHDTGPHPTGGGRWITDGYLVQSEKGWELFAHQFLAQHFNVNDGIKAVGVVG